MENRIEIRNLNKFYGKKQALYDINLSIEQGMFGLLGRNGAGEDNVDEDPCQSAAEEERSDRCLRYSC